MGAAEKGYKDYRDTPVYEALQYACLLWQEAEEVSCVRPA